MSFQPGEPPLLKSPMTDFTSLLGIPDLQLSGSLQCKRFEMKYFKCLEAYGIDKGYDKCADYYEDLMECKFGEKQIKRIKKISREIKKQIKEGKRTYLDPPNYDITYNFDN